MDDVNIWRPLQETLHKLRSIKKRTNNEIPCEPQIIVQEDLLAIGVLTETNQFIQFSIYTIFNLYNS